ncbi:hypothetical protein PCK2_000694 [Pneumocystis canis]|nr:hypothetical protein PCK2_000694 [Pneumocystis canis]
MNHATIIIRLIKSFIYRTIKYLILHEIDLEQTTVNELQQRIHRDTLKIYAHAYQTKNMKQNCRFSGEQITNNLKHVLKKDDSKIVDSDTSIE